MEQCNNKTFIAKVICVEKCKLLVCDCCTNQEVVVHTNKACCFACGDCVCVYYNGAMTMSLPPQVTAICIKKHF